MYAGFIKEVLYSPCCPEMEYRMINLTMKGNITA